MAISNNFYGSYLKQNNAGGATDSYTPPPNAMQNAMANPYAPTPISPSSPSAFMPNAANMGGYSSTPTGNVRSATYTPGPGVGQLPLPQGQKGSQGPITVGKATNNASRLANSEWQAFGPLQGMTANIFQQALSGNLSDAVRQLAAPDIAQIQLALKHALEQQENTLQGGNLQEAHANAIQASIQAIANALHGYQAPIVSGAMEQGSNIASRAMTPFMQLASILLQQKAMQQANNAQSGGLFGF